jgi:hypothetical protein
MTTPDLIDRLVASTAGMASTLYIIAACVAWARVIYPPPSRSLGAKVIFDRAVAWTALATLFGLVSTVKLHLAGWADDGIDVLLAAINVAVFGAGLVSVRAITAEAFGARALAVVAIVSLAVGVFILLF